ncbi:MmpS family transport accessory protein [Streptomyces parvus]|uniref:MmpS family transport accessory protein n=1 Tax=Streptomyces parvus TaxID=66428 RepID=UPI0021013F2D|nr:MmpS family transport accessory protein [Streptomyces parvus]MCQ1577562.1 MmpS family transport accessory protein [Streptomyces parvus]
MPSKESTESPEPEEMSVETLHTQAPDAEPADAEAANTETADTGTANKSPDKGTDGSRAGMAIAAALLLACGGLVGYGVLDTEEKPKAPTVPSAAVTYEVTGEGPVEISYLGRDEDGQATVVRDAELPWKQTVQVPLGKAPTVAIVLGEKGGQAACTLAIRGKHVQRATAMNEFGRATCAGELPATEN